MSSVPENRGKGKGILTDVTKCIGCDRCVQACVQRHKLPADLPSKFKMDDGLSGARFTSIVEIPGPGEESRFVRRQCVHCQEPTCAAACLVGALVKRPDGPVEYHAEKCIGCRYCMLACPFMIPRYEYERPLPYIRKCKMNEDCRVEGGAPACTSICPTGATVFGLRDDLIAEAKRRIEERPDLYVDHVWGEHDFGGTSVIYIGDVHLGKVLKIPTPEALKKMAVPSLTHDSIPDLMHDWVLVTPFQFFTVAATLGGVWFLRRRSRVMSEEAAEEARMLEGKRTKHE